MSKIHRTIRPAALAASLVSVLALGGIAQAADAIEAPPAPAEPMAVPPVASWGGAYAGVQAGYGFGGSTKDRTFDNRVDTDGFVGGGFLGYNYDTGQGIIAGVEGDIGYSGVSGENAGTRVRSGLDGSLRARLGYTVTPDVLVYTTAGGAAKRTSFEEGGIKDSKSQLGWTAGVGTDVKVTENMFARVEYRYTDYGSDNFSTGSGDRSVSSKDNRVLVGLGVKF